MTNATISRPNTIETRSYMRGYGVRIGLSACLLLVSGCSHYHSNLLDCDTTVKHETVSQDESDGASITLHDGGLFDGEPAPIGHLHVGLGPSAPLKQLAPKIGCNAGDTQSGQSLQTDAIEQITKESIVNATGTLNAAVGAGAIAIPVVASVILAAETTIGASHGTH